MSQIKRQDLTKMTEKMMTGKRRMNHCFRKPEIEHLIAMFVARTHDTKSKLDRAMFRDVLYQEFGMTSDILMDRIFKAFDKDSDNFISLDEWVDGLSVFLKGKQIDKIKYCFCVYDLNNDGYISREEMFQFLKSSMTKHQNEDDPDEAIKDLVEILIKKLDYDHDSRISLNDFKTAVEENNLLLESLGTCLPCREVIELFMHKLLTDSRV